jgi:antitoxin VapB
VTEALRDRLKRETRRRDVGRITHELMELGRRYAALPDADTRGAAHILGYDENGLPT